MAELKRTELTVRINSKLDKLPKDAQLVAVRGKSKLYSVPSFGENGGLIDNGETLTVVNVQAALLRGYWEEPKKQKYNSPEVAKVKILDA